MALFAHGNSNIQGHFEVKATGGMATFTLYLRPFEPNSLDEVEVSIRIAPDFTNPLVSLNKIDQGQYSIQLALVDGDQNPRVYLKAHDRDEIGMGGFIWEKRKRHSPLN